MAIAFRETVANGGDERTSAAHGKNKGGTAGQELDLKSWHKLVVSVTCTVDNAARRLECGGGSSNYTRRPFCRPQMG